LNAVMFPPLPPSVSPSPPKVVMVPENEYTETASTDSK